MVNQSRLNVNNGGETQMDEMQERETSGTVAAGYNARIGHFAKVAKMPELMQYMNA